MRLRTHADRGRSRSGIVLLITLVIVVILASVGYALTARIAARRHRNNFLVDRAQAQYACDSAMKYALISLNSLDAKLISRPNEPDFSDVFAMNDTAYSAMLAQFAKDHPQRGAADGKKPGAAAPDGNDANDRQAGAGSDLASAKVPGPYGPEWPLVTGLSQLEIGSAQVTIEVEDENAKYPLGWGMVTDPNVQARAAVSFTTFCEWMKCNEEEIKNLRESLAKVNTIRPFKVTFNPISVAMPMPNTLNARTRSGATGGALSNPALPGGTPASRSAPGTPTGPSGGTPAARGAATTPVVPPGIAVRQPPRRTVSPAEQAVQQGADMARFFEGGMIDTELLSRPTVVSSERTETAMKYLGLWGTRQVNVNTAPRHVLEAAFTFGSIADAPKMAGAVITQRRIKPFQSIDEVKKMLFRYSDAVDKCRDFITTTSTVFTVRVTAVCGVAKVVTVAGLTREGRQVKRIAVLSE